VSRGPRVFISCPSSDNRIAEEIANGLSAQGISSFFAPRDLGPGTDFALEIVKAIAGCEVVLVLLSAEAVRSPHVRREVSLAVEERRRLAPLAMPGTRFPVGLPPEWSYWMSAVQVTPFPGVDETIALLDELVAPGDQDAEMAAAGLASSQRLRAPARRIQVRHAASVSTRRGNVAPSTLLRAESGLLPVIGREAELARLELWAIRDDVFGSRLVTGAAGQGKTRLATELGARLAALKWEVQFARRSESGRALVDALPEHPTLLVVDYAETRVEQLAELLETIADLGLYAPVRLLMLARGSGDWWKRLTSRSALVDDMLAGTETLNLTPLTNDHITVLEIYRAARAAFEAALGLEDGGTAHLTYRRYGSILDVLESALLDVIANSSNGQDATRVTSRLLAHERRYIQAAASEDGLGELDGVDLDRFIGMLTVFGARDEQSAVALLRSVDADSPPTTLRKMARLFRRLYPGDDMYIEGLRPDSLAEDLIVQLVKDEGSLPGGSELWKAIDLEPARRRHALIVVSRAAATHDEVLSELRRIILGAHLETLVAAIDVATQLPDPTTLVSLLTEALEVQGRTASEALKMLDLVPEETIALAGLAASLAEVVVNGLPPEGARNLSSIDLLLVASNRFSDAGWGERAVMHVESAVRDLERLAMSTSGIDETLARSQSNLSNRLWEIGRVAEALAPAQLAVDTFHGHGVTGVAVAGAENNLAFRLAESGDLDAAARHARTAERTFREALAGGASNAESGLASSLNNLTCIDMGLRRYADAAAHGRDAVSIRRAQAFSDRDRFLPFVARALANAAPATMAAGNNGAGLGMIAEARALHEIVAPRAPIFRYEQAESATIEAVMLATLGEIERARDALRLAAALLESLADLLGELNTRLHRVVVCGLRALDASKGLGWGDVEVARHPTDWASSRLTLPLLMEYKDL